MARHPFEYARLRLRGESAHARQYIRTARALLFQTWLVKDRAGVPTFSIKRELPDGAKISVLIAGDDHIVEIIPPGVPINAPITKEEKLPGGTGLRREDVCSTGLHIQRHPRGVVETTPPYDPEGDARPVLATTLYSFDGLRYFEITTETEPPYQIKDWQQYCEGERYPPPPSPDIPTWIVYEYGGPLIPDMDSPVAWFGGSGGLYNNYGRNWGLREAQRRMACLTTEYVSPSGKRYAVCPGTTPCNTGHPLLQWGGSFGVSHQPKGWPATFTDPETGQPGVGLIMHGMPTNGASFMVAKGTSLPAILGATTIEAALPWESATTFEIMDISKDGRKVLVLAMVASTNAEDLPNRTWVEGGSYSGSYLSIFNEGRGIITRPMRVIKGILEYVFSEDLTSVEVTALKEADGEGAETKGGTIHSWVSTDDPEAAEYDPPEDQLPTQVNKLYPFIRYKVMSELAKNTPGTYTEVVEMYPGKVPGGPDEALEVEDFDPGEDGHYEVGNLPAESSTVTRPSSMVFAPFMSLFVDFPGQSFDVGMNETCTQYLGAYYDDAGAVQYVEYEADWTLTYTMTPMILSTGVLRLERRVTQSSDGSGGASIDKIEYRVPTNTAVWEVQYDVVCHQVANCTHTHPHQTTAWKVESDGIPYTLVHRARHWLTTYTTDELWDNYRKPPFRGAPAVGSDAPTTFEWTEDPLELNMGLDGDAFVHAPNDGFVKVTGDLADGLLIKHNLAEEFYATKVPTPMGHWYMEEFGIGQLFYFPVTTRNLMSLLGAAISGRGGGGNDLAIYNMPPTRTFVSRMGVTRYSSDQLLMVRGLNSFVEYDFLQHGDTYNPPIVVVGNVQRIGGSGVLEFFDAGLNGPKTNYVQANYAAEVDAGLNTLDGSGGYQYPRAESYEMRTAIATPAGVAHASWQDTNKVDPMLGGGWFSGWSSDPSSWPDTMHKPFAREHNGSYNPITGQLTVQFNHMNCWLGEYEPLEDMLLRYPAHPLLAKLYVGDTSVPGFEEMEEAE